MSDKPTEADKRARMAESVWKVVTRRERAPRSPQMERALKRLMLRYNRDIRTLATGSDERADI